MSHDSQELSVNVESFHRVDLITVSGRLHSGNAHDLEEMFQELAAKNRYQYVVDLSGVSYMSSAGLRSLVSTLRQNKKNGGDLRLSDPSDRVVEVLKLAGLHAIFQAYDTAVAAVGSY